MDFTIPFETITCYTCKVLFALPKQAVDDLRRCHNTFYCPNGHGQCYGGENETEKWKRIAQSKEDDYSYQCAENKRLSRSMSNLKGQLTKAKKKIKS